MRSKEADPHSKQQYLLLKMKCKELRSTVFCGVGIYLIIQLHNIYIALLAVENCNFILA